MAVSNSKLLNNRLFLFLACMIIAAAVGTALWDLLSGAAVPLWDAENQFGPYFIYAGDSLRSGRLLIWNPFTNAGSPDFIEPQWGSFSPLLLCMAAISSPSLSGYMLYWCTLLVLGGIGMLLLARHLGYPGWLGLCGGLGFIGSGFFIGHAQHMSFTSALVWLPWILWRLDAAMMRNRIQPALEAGCFWGLSALAGYPGVVMVMGLLAGLWWFGRAVQLRITRRRSAVRSLTVACLSALIGLVVLLPPYLGMITEGAGYSYRSHVLDRDYAILVNALVPSVAATLSSPFVSVLHTDAFPEWAGIDRSMTPLYIPAVLLAGALAAVWVSRNRGWTLWLAVLTVFFFSAAFRPPCPVRGWLYDLLPPFRYFRHAAMFRGAFICVLLILGMQGWSVLLEEDRAHRRRWFMVLSGVMITVSAVIFHHAMGVVPDRYGTDTALWHWFTAWGGLLIMTALLQWPAVLRRGWLIPLLLMAVCTADSILSYRASRYIVHDNGMKRKIWAQVTAHHVPGLDLLENSKDRLPRVIIPEIWELESNKNLVLKLPVLRVQVPLANEYVTGTVDNPVLCRSAVGMHRMYFSPETAMIPVTQHLFAVLGDRSLELGNPLLVIHSPDAMCCDGSHTPETSTLSNQENRMRALPPATPVSHEYLEYTPTRLSLRVTSGEPGWLMVTDRWSSSWRAEVNGEPVTVYGANFVFRAVQVPAGSSVITFEYRPLVFPFLAALSWSVLILVALRRAFFAFRGF